MIRHPVLWLIVVAGFLLTACTDNGQQWHGKDISGLMPELRFQLINSRGETVTAAESQGDVRLLYFGFTSCPDVCPTTLAKFSRAVRQLPKSQREAITTLFVSVDPKRDTPERLASYVDFFGEGITGLTGTEPQLRALSKRYRTTFGYDEPDANGNYNVSHSSAVYVFDHKGRARLLLRPDLSPQEISEDLARLADEATGV
ncbi:SCO family protein [Marinobacter nauticus]